MVAFQFGFWQGKKGKERLLQSYILAHCGTGTYSYKGTATILLTAAWPNQCAKCTAKQPSSHMDAEKAGQTCLK